MKKQKKIVAWAIALSLLITSLSTTAYALDNESTNSISGENTVIEENQTNEQAKDTDESIDQSLKTQEVTADQNPDKTEESSSVEKPKALEYIYIDEQTINVPEEQNIMVAFADTELKLESATIHGHLDEDNTTFDIVSSKIVDNTVLFTKNYADVTEVGTYKLDSISYQIQGQEQDISISLKDQEITAEYIVTTEAEKENVIETSENLPGVTVYSIDDEGNTVEQSSTTDSIEDSVETVLSVVDENSVENESGARTGRAKEKVIVICAGHDASHPGATGSGLKEEQLTFKVAQYCKAELEQYSGVKVYLDRNSVQCAYPGQSSNYCLNQRVIDAAAKGASTFVDIHFNKANGAAKGAEIYVPNNSYSSAIHQDGVSLGNNILAQLSALGLYNRGTKVKDCTTNDRDPNGILEDYFTTNNLSKEYGMTGIIVEHAFLDNADDAAKLRDENFLKQLGEADARGIANTYGLTKGANIEVLNKDDFDGTAQIKITGAGAGANVAIWSDVNGQDDLNWTSVNGNLTINFNKRDYKNSTGTYNIHLYDAKNRLLKSVRFRVSSNTGSDLTITNINNQEKTYHIKLKFKDMPDEITTVQFPVWANKKQSDLKWYTARQTSKGVWEADVAVSSHKLSGTYQVHVYATNESGKQRFLKNGTFTVSQPTVSTLKAQNYNQNAGTFDVVVAGITSKSGVSKVQIPVWSTSTQSDLVWYTATKQKDGSYKAKINLANHQNHIGRYQIHMYLTSGNGIRIGKTTTYDVKNSTATIQVNDASNGKETNYTIKATNMGLYGNCSSVQYAVWSEANGQDDLIWYNGQKINSELWQTKVDISRHHTSGRYRVDVYATINAVQRGVGSTTFTVTNPSVSTFKIENYNQSAGTFDVIVSGINSKSGVKKVQVPVWSTSNQSDLVWYNATRQSDGSYRVKVSIANHQYHTGTYQVHMYLTSGNGIQIGKTTTYNVKNPTATIQVNDASNGKETNYTIKATNMGLYGNCSSVQYAVWSEANGQDDLIWYNGQKIHSGLWQTKVDISRHHTSGRYRVDVYATINGVLRGIGSRSFTVSNPTVSTLKVENFNENTGNFEVVVSGISSKSGVEKVLVPVWSTSNQSDLVWYTATRQSNGSYRVNVSIANHKNHTGTYQIHMYLTAGNKVQVFKSTSFKVVLAEKYSIMGTSSVTVDQMVRYFNANATYPSSALAKGGAKDIRTFCTIYKEEAEAEGVRVEVAFAQAMKETGYLKFGGIVKIEQYNFAGIGALDNNSKGQCASFKDVRTGVRAQIQHLKGYASKSALKQTCVNPRFTYIQRGCAPYVQWLGINENPSGKGWATEKNYGHSINNDYIKKILKF